MALLYGITTVARLAGGLTVLLFAVSVPVVAVGSPLFPIGLAAAAVAVSLVYFDIAGAAPAVFYVGVRE
jgi:hypothetical protein